MNRLNRWIIYLWNRYIPCSKKIVEYESKRLALFIFDNYDYEQYPKLLEGIRKELLNKLKTESVNKLDNIITTQKEMETIGNITNLLDESKILIK